jgi:hypothetical protein
MRGASGRLPHGRGRCGTYGTHPRDSSIFAWHLWRAADSSGTIGSEYPFRLQARRAPDEGSGPEGREPAPVEDYDSGCQDARPAPDLVNRNFVGPAPNSVWVADITYIPAWAGFLYLPVVLDMAIGQRRPAAVIYHSGQGS